jgi:hypothetical protein
VKFEQAMNMLKIFKSFAFKTSTLDDFPIFENEHQVLQDKRSRQHAQQHHDQHSQVHSFSTGSSDEKLINNSDAVELILCRDAF